MTDLPTVSHRHKSMSSRQEASQTVVLIKHPHPPIPSDNLRRRHIVQFLHIVAELFVQEAFLSLCPAGGMNSLPQTRVLQYAAVLDTHYIISLCNRRSQPAGDHTKSAPAPDCQF